MHYSIKRWTHCDRNAEILFVPLLLDRWEPDEEAASLCPTCDTCAMKGLATWATLVIGLYNQHPQKKPPWKWHSFRLVEQLRCDLFCLERLGRQQPPVTSNMPVANVMTYCVLPQTQQRCQKPPAKSCRTSQNQSPSGTVLVFLPKTYMQGTKILQDPKNNVVSDIDPAGWAWPQLSFVA